MSKQYQSPLRVVLLAAGQGKRMKSQLPKVLHPVLGKAILARILDAVDELGAEHVHIVVGHAADQVRSFLEANPPKTPWSTHLQEPQLGTGHALMQVSPDLKSFKGTLLVSVADAPLLSAPTLASLVDAHQKEKATLSLLTTVVEDPRSYGRIVRGGDGNVERIVEDKDASPRQKEIREINPAIYCFEWPAVEPGLANLGNDNNQKEYYLTDLLGWASKGKMKIADAVCADWREVSGINSRVELSEANRLMRDFVLQKLQLESGVTIVDVENTWISPEVKIGQETTILPGCNIMGTVEIGAACVIGPNAQISGPTKIGSRCQIVQSVISGSSIDDDCRVGPFAHLRDGASISDKCRIGNFVEVKKSDVGSSTNISHLSYIGDASLGQSVNIGAGTITANYDRLSGKKSKTIIGDGSSTGCNSVLIAPVVIGHEVMVGAGSVITKDVPDGALAVARAPQKNLAEWVANRIKQNEQDKTQPMPAQEPSRG